MMRGSSSIVREETLPIGIVDPTGEAKIVWDFFVSACVVYLTMTMPFSLGFHAEATWQRARLRYVVDWAVDAVFFLDMCLCFCVAYTSNEGVLVTDRCRVFRKYFFSFGFAIDFLSIASRFSGYFLGKSSSFLKNARLLRMVRLTKLFKLTRILKLKRGSKSCEEEEAATNPIFKIIKHNADSLPNSQRRRVDGAAARAQNSTWTTMKSLATHPTAASASWMFVVLFVIAHMVACAWHGLVGFNESSKERHWINANNLVDATTKKAYLASLYWAFTTMTTVGYGDIVVASNDEKTFAIVVMIIGGICFGYIIGNVSAMLENLDMVATLHDQKLDAVKEYLYDRQYPAAVAVKIKQHFRFAYGKLGVFYDAQDIYDGLPRSVQIDLAYEQRAQLVERSSFLSHELATGTFVANICRKLIPCKADDGEMLFFQGDIGTHVYLVDTGSVKTNATNDGNGGVGVLREFSQGDMVGAEAVLVTYTHAFSAFTASKAELYAITKDDLLLELDANAPEITQWLMNKICEETEEAAPGQSIVKDNLSSSSSTSEKDDVGASLSAFLDDVVLPCTMKEKNDACKSNVRQRISPTLAEKYGGEVAPVKSPNENFLFRRFGLFDPESPGKVAWDVFVSMLIIFSVASSTYSYAFGLPPRKLCGLDALREDRWLIVFVCIDVCFFLDVLATCNTALIQEDGTTATKTGRNAYVLSRRVILTKYARSGWLAVDFLSSIPLNKGVPCFIEGGTMVFTLLKLLRGLRLIRLAKMRQKFKLAAFCERLEDSTGINPALLKLIKPLAVMSIVAHAFTCLYFYVGRYDNSWLETTGTKQEDRPTQYIVALYWAFATMTTVGYGDVHPELTNSWELVVGIMSSVLGTMIFAYVIGILVGLVSNLDPSTRLFRSEIAYAGHYLEGIRDISDPLKKKLATAQTHALDVNGVFDEASILEQLPPYLKANCLLYVYRDSLPYMPFLSELEASHSGSLTLLLPLLRPVKYLHGQIINSPSISAREMHFVVKGLVIVTRSSSRKYRDYQGDQQKDEQNAEQQNGGSSSLGASLRKLGAESYGPQTHFGEATVLLPATSPFRLRLRVICDSCFSHTFVMAKNDMESLRLNYEPLLNAIEAELYDEDLLSQWIKEIELTRL